MDWQLLLDFAVKNAYLFSGGVTLILFGFFVDGLRGAVATGFVAVGSYLLYLNNLLPF